MRSVVDDGEAAVLGVAVAWRWLEGGRVSSEMLRDAWRRSGAKAFWSRRWWLVVKQRARRWLRNIVECGGLDDGACSVEKLVFAGCVDESLRVDQGRALLHGVLGFVDAILYEKHEGVAFGFDEDASVFAAANACKQGCEIEAAMPAMGKAPHATGQWLDGG